MASARKLINLIKLLLGWPFAALAILFILRFILQNSSHVLLRIKSLDPFLLAFGFLSFFIYYVIRIVGWRRLVTNMGNKVNFKETSYAWEFSEIKRFVPGNIWSFLSRAELFELVGVPKKVSAKAILLEIEFLILSNAILSFLALPLIANYLHFNAAKLIPISILLILVISLVIVCGSKLSAKLNKILPNFGPAENFLILFIYIGAFFFFSLGIYLSCASVLGLVENPNILIGFFAFSFLVGYLSLITPSGIGVREAVVTYGLSSALSLPVAGFIAIFSRIVLVLSELLFALAILIWHKSKVWNF